ncbi:Ferredoxin thioredoxin reductase, alpha chain [Dillenia turbinata]|uniref:Ferredoxin thioredoxin reductase, alpha chain n=1 Tax=Dillenia turbinata TaxID=194707 RepID=A0AAN8Z3G4_9MAGN
MTTITVSVALSSSTINRRNAVVSSSSSSSRPFENRNQIICSGKIRLSVKSTRGGGRICCEVALRTNPKPASFDNDDDSPSSSSSASTESEKIGARVRVKVPLKVYHVPRVPDVDLTGMEGELKQYVGLWKGMRISANLPYKVEFVKEIEGRGPVKFFAHLKEDEFDYV